MAINIELGINGKQPCENNPTQDQDSKTFSFTKWGLILLNYAFYAIGNIGGPMLSRIYYMHGGSRKWLFSWIQVVGFPLMFAPITVLYLRDSKSGIKNIASPHLIRYSAVTGLITGIISLTYSYGLAFLPMSTVTILMATNLAFTALFAKLLVRQKFTAFSINAVVLMTVSAVLLGMKKDADRLPGVSNGEYLLGFLLTMGTAALSGFMLPYSEYAYAKAGKAINYSVVLQFTCVVNFVATIFCTIGMIISKDFQAIAGEAREFGLGMTKYYLILASSVIVWSMLTLGSFGLVYCTSSLSLGIYGSLLLPVAEIASVAVFHEKLTGEKGISTALCLWGFTSYFYGSYKENKKQKAIPLES